MIINQINFKKMTNLNYTTKARLAKSCLIFLLSVVFLCGCTFCNKNETVGNENETVKWINEHKKPIRCIYAGENMSGENIYTLIDKDGNTTRAVEMELPDTIRVWKRKNY